MRPWIGILLVGLLAGCQERQPRETFVARVGDALLTQGELDMRLARLAVGLDTMEARRQLINQWITSELLYQEARRRRLGAQESVRDRLAASERAILIDALIAQAHDQVSADYTPGDVKAYFEKHSGNMRLLEPFVRVRYLEGGTRDSVALAARMLNAAQPSEADSIFENVALRFATDAAGSVAVARSFHPEARLLTDLPAVHAAISRSSPGSSAQVIAIDTTWHLVQLVDRAPVGSIPELAWVDDVVRSQLDIETRKRNYLRTVQRLRLEAGAREEIEVR